MHVRNLVSRWLQGRNIIAHDTRAQSLAKAVAALVLGGRAAGDILRQIRRPVVVVDWSDFECRKGRKWAMLKAGVAAQGRCFVVYSRVFPFRKYNSPEAHREFLQGLSRVLPPRHRGSSQLRFLTTVIPGES